MLTFLLLLSIIIAFVVMIWIINIYLERRHNKAMQEYMKRSYKYDIAPEDNIHPELFTKEHNKAVKNEIMALIVKIVSQHGIIRPRELYEGLTNHFEDDPRENKPTKKQMYQATKQLKSDNIIRHCRTYYQTEDMAKKCLFIGMVHPSKN